MAKRTITMRLGTSSIDSAIKELNAYKKDLNHKVNTLIDAMVRYGEDYALNAVGHVRTGETLTTVVGYRRGNAGFVFAGGNAIWMEFGTGVRYNGPAGGSPHPKGKELGMLIGEYGEGKGVNPNGWWYYDGEDVKHTYGIEANMFMYKTAQELRRVYPELAKEVFG